MNYVFTHFIQSLQSNGEPSDPTAFPKLWRALRRLLARELKRRGLWDYSPRLLGIDGYSEWRVTGVGRFSSKQQQDEKPIEELQDALDELATDAYVYIFVKRLRSLRAQLLVKPQIEGLVSLNVKNFLHEVQKKNDPLGYRVYAVLRSALVKLLELEKLFILTGGSKIGNETIFATSRLMETKAPKGLDLTAQVQTWNDELLPELLTARGEQRTKIVERLGALVLGLPKQGVSVFGFRQVVEPLKMDVRRRWAALWQLEGGELGVEDGGDDLVHLVRMVHPSQALEELDYVEKMFRCVESGLHELQLQARTREHLLKIWDFLRLTGKGAGPNAGGKYSNRELAKLLGIPRDRLPALFASLKEQVEHCRASLMDGTTTAGLTEALLGSYAAKISADGKTPQAAMLEWLREAFLAQPIVAEEETTDEPSPVEEPPSIEEPPFTEEPSSVELPSVEPPSAEPPSVEPPSAELPSTHQATQSALEGVPKKLDSAYSLRRPWRLAASVILAVGAGLAGVQSFEQMRRVQYLDSQRQRLKTEKEALQAEVEALTVEARQEAITNAPWAFLNEGVERSNPDALFIPPGTPWVALLPVLPPSEIGDVLELYRRLDGELVWRSEPAKESDNPEPLLLLRAELFESGAYQLRLLRKGKIESQFEFTVIVER